LWRLVKEVPEVAIVYIALFEVIRRQRNRHQTRTDLRASQPTILRLSPARGTSSARIELTTPTLALTTLPPSLLDSMAEMDPSFPQF
jgi:hypothetical protein